MNVIDLDRQVGPLRVHGVVHVEGPFFEGTSTAVEDPTTAYKGQALAARIERAMNSAIQCFEADMLQGDGQ